MNVLLAPDSFKGCLTSSEVCAAMEKGIKQADKSINVLRFPSSDGGEGFCDCMRNIYGGNTIESEVTWPLGDRGKARFIYNSITKTAYIELASASGLMLVPKEKRNILNSSTLGTGELIKNAMDIGAKTIVVGLGGSATNDCGMGLLYALGMRFLDSAGFELKPAARSMARVSYVVKDKMVDISAVNFVAACDVKNILCGENGAAEIFSRQKGASEEEVAFLDKAAARFANVLGIDSNLQGAGAAGGVGAAMLSVLNAKYVSGASLLVSSPSFQSALRKADLLITGEGNTDAQTAFGKLVSVVLASAKTKNVKAVVLSGGLSDGYEKLREHGAMAFYSLTESGYDVDYCIAHAAELISDVANRIVRNHY